MRANRCASFVLLSLAITTSILSNRLRKNSVERWLLPQELAAICPRSIAGTREDFGGSNLEGLGQAVYPLG